MDKAQYLDAIRTNVDALVGAAEAAGPEANVPSCPDWTVSDLLGHIGRVQRWATACVERGEPVDREALEKPPEAAARPYWVRTGADRLLEVLGAREPDEPTWTFLGPGNVGFWHRRQACEVAIHRWDAQAAADTTEPVEFELAVDGIDEHLGLVASLASAESFGAANQTVHLHVTDAAGEWMVRIDDQGMKVTREHAKGDVAVRGPASELFLMMWGRRSPDADSIEVIGDRDALSVLLDAAKR